jgi:hypothetical protein
MKQKTTKQRIKAVKKAFKEYHVEYNMKKKKKRSRTKWIERVIIPNAVNRKNHYMYWVNDSGDVIESKMPKRFWGVKEW